MTASSENLAKLSDQNPWPGLAAYDEISKDYFFGRNEEAAEVFRLIRLSPLTVVYGKSGLGKTSLLQAGVYPLLRAGRYMPIHLRIDYSAEASVQPFRQVMQRIKEECEEVKAECPDFVHDESLWDYLHRKDFEIWSVDNFPLIPVLVFDQFEELFSRGDGGIADLRQQIFDELADLIENRIPPEIVNADSGQSHERLDFFSQRYRIVLSFREDYLPIVRTLEQRAPSLLRNYLRLDPMSRQRAIDAVERAGKAILYTGVSASIVDFISKIDWAEAASASSGLTIEPVLLSLCCYQLNRRRLPGAKIDQALLLSAGQDILNSFYRQALDDPEVKGLPDVEVFIEDCLLQGDHFRGAYPKEAAIKNELLTEKQLAVLTNTHRLLRVVPYPDTVRVELIHDRLVPVVRKSRDDRRLRQERYAKRRRLLRMLFFPSITFIVAFIIVGGTYLKKLEEVRIQGTASNLHAEAQDIMVGNQPGGWALGLSKLLAAYQILPTTAGIEPTMQTHIFALQSLVKIIATLYPVYTVAFSHDGTRVISSMNQALQLWDARTGQPIGAPLEGHEGYVTSVAFSPDDSQVLSGSADHTVRLWNVQTGKLLKELKGHTDAVLSVAFSPDGRQVVSGSADRTVQLWNWQDDQPIGVALKGHADFVTSVAFSPDGTHVLSGSTDRTVRLWDVQTGKLLKELKGHKDAVLSVAFSQDGRQVVSGSADRTVQLWDAQTGQPIGVALKGHKGAILRAAFSQDGSHILSVGKEQVLRRWMPPSARKDLPNLLCAKLASNMSDKEWREQVSRDIDYHKQCPHLPIRQDPFLELRTNPSTHGL